MKKMIGRSKIYRQPIQEVLKKKSRNFSQRKIGEYKEMIKESKNVSQT